MCVLRNPSIHRNGSCLKIPSFQWPEPIHRSYLPQNKGLWCRGYPHDIWPEIGIERWYYMVRFWMYQAIFWDPATLMYQPIIPLIRCNAVAWFNVVRPRTKNWRRWLNSWDKSWRGCSALVRGGRCLLKTWAIASGKRWHSYGTSPFLMGKLTINPSGKRWHSELAPSSCFLTG